MLSHHGTQTGLRLARKHIAWYSKGLPGSAEFRSEVNRVESPAEVVALIERYYRPLLDLGLEAARARFHALGQDRLAA